MRKITGRERTQIRKMRLEGKSLQKIGDDFNISSSHVYYYVKDLPVPEFYRGRKASFNHQRARRLRKEGFTYAELAERFGVTRSAIFYVCNPRKSNVDSDP